jgi:hypothetical protein
MPGGFASPFSLCFFQTSRPIGPGREITKFFSFKTREFVRRVFPKKKTDTGAMFWNQAKGFWN